MLVLVCVFWHGKVYEFCLLYFYSKQCSRKQFECDDPELMETSVESAIPQVLAQLEGEAVDMGSPSSSSRSPMDPLRVTFNLSRQSTNPASCASSDVVDTPTPSMTPTHSDQGPLSL